MSISTEKQFSDDVILIMKAFNDVIEYNSTPKNIYKFRVSSEEVD